MQAQNGKLAIGLEMGPGGVFYRANRSWQPPTQFCKSAALNFMYRFNDFLALRGGVEYLHFTRQSQYSMYPGSGLFFGPIAYREFRETIRTPILLRCNFGPSRRLFFHAGFFVEADVTFQATYIYDNGKESVIKSKPDQIRPMGGMAIGIGGVFPISHRFIITSEVRASPYVQFGEFYNYPDISGRGIGTTQLFVGLTYQIKPKASRE